MLFRSLLLYVLFSLALAACNGQEPSVENNSRDAITDSDHPRRDRPADPISSGDSSTDTEPGEDTDPGEVGDTVAQDATPDTPTEDVDHEAGDAETEAGDAETEAGDAETEAGDAETETGDAAIDGHDAETDRAAGDAGTEPDAASVESCDDIEGEYQTTVLAAQRCTAPGLCHVLLGHCGVGLGGCYYGANTDLTQEILDAIAARWVSAGCMEGAAVCGCSAPPSVRCDSGGCLLRD
jgi:hypothetical protein